MEVQLIRVTVDGTEQKTWIQAWMVWCQQQAKKLVNWYMLKCWLHIAKCASLEYSEMKLKLYIFSGAPKANYADVSGEMEATGVVVMSEHSVTCTDSI